MRIVIDLQAAQSTGSRNRGIGRYSLSLAQAMVRNRGPHEILIALSGLFPETIAPLRDLFAGLLPAENIRVWQAPGPVNGLEAGNDWRRQAAELVREAFLASLKPDMVHVSSLFEGLIDDAVTTVGVLSARVPTAVTLYDLIPYVHRQVYLENKAVESWYLGKLESLRRADLWLAISESSRQEGVACLGLADERSINISTDADPHFRPLEFSVAAEQSLRQRYGLPRPLVMYTGGIDHRKNIEGLIRAFAQLPPALRRAHQLAIVCSIQDQDRRTLAELAARLGLDQDELVCTGFIPEDDLVALYNLCRLFVFPSWHEGFGLPALEAMRCGAPVIAAATSSLPEVIGWSEALFDPHDDQAMAMAMTRGLDDETFRAELVRRGREQAGKFSWDESARRAIAAMAAFHAARPADPGLNAGTTPRPRLAFAGPLPPVKSGIADYSAELLPRLARWYEISVIVDQEEVSDPWIKAHCPIHSPSWLVEHVDSYERVLYHLGNSHFHSPLFELMGAVPGVVVLHDFFLSAALAHGENFPGQTGGWARELYHSHGYGAVRDFFLGSDREEVAWRYPCSLSAIQQGLGVIVHSSHSLRLAQQWYGGDAADWSVLPLLRAEPIGGDRLAARRALGFGDEDFLVCAFGLLGPTKLNHRLVQAWLQSGLAGDKNCHLLFVGEDHRGDYGRELHRLMDASPAAANIRITGWTEREAFHRHLAAADLAVQLRTLSRGETSAAVLDCLNYGLATIVNANGSMADLDQQAVWMLADTFADAQLVTALETLWQDRGRRLRLGQAGRDLIRDRHHPQACADQYGAAIESCYQAAADGLPALPAAIAGLVAQEPDEGELMRLAEAIATSIPLRNRPRQLLVDISALQTGESEGQGLAGGVLRSWLDQPPPGMRVEPVYARGEQGYSYGRRFTLGLLACPDRGFDDDPIDYGIGDVFFALALPVSVAVAQGPYYQGLRRQGVRVFFVLSDWPDPLVVGEGAEGHDDWLPLIAAGNGVLCASKALADRLTAWIGTRAVVPGPPLIIDWLGPEGTAGAADPVTDYLERCNRFFALGGPAAAGDE